MREFEHDQRKYVNEFYLLSYKAWKYDYEKIERATLIEWCLRLLPDVAGVEFCL